MRRLREYFPTVIQHLGDVPIHALQVQKVSFVVRPEEIPFVGDRFHFHF
jgi:hypothetical protein